MDRYKNLMVGLNLSDQDVTTIRYAAMISRLAKTEKIYFIHVTENLEIPDDVRAEFPDLLERADEFAVNEMKTMIDRYFDGYPGAERIHNVVEGVPLSVLLEWSHQKDIDLFLMGRKKESGENSKLAVKLVRKAPCSVFIVPEGSEAKITRVLVPVDFSRNSAEALEVAIAFASTSTGAAIECLHVYRLPTGYYKTGKTFEEFAAIMKGHAEKAYRNLISTFDHKGLSIAPLFELDNNPSKAIKAIAEKQRADLLVMGARGKNDAAAVLLGSVTERLIRTTDIPLLAVKKKGASLGLLEAILREAKIIYSA
ncbi:MAG: universal stress protein [candidate division KSB1 bacterium]|nr:universal stress protein [candidate division KSB1 bacterium]